MRLWASLAALFASVAMGDDAGIEWGKTMAKQMTWTQVQVGNSYPTVDWPSAIVDWANPPSFEQRIKEDACDSNWHSCWKAVFTRRTEFIEDPIPEALQPFRHLLTAQPRHNVSIYATRRAEKYRYHNQDTTYLMGAFKSRPIVHQPPKNWHFVANLVNEEGSNDTTLHLSKETSQQPTVQTEYEVVEKMKCPPQSACYMETWTFHVNLSGYCRKRPTVTCGNDDKEMDICSPLTLQPEHNQIKKTRFHAWSSCSQFDEFVWESCFEKSVDICLGPTADECNVSAPIFWNGKPLSIMVAHSVPLSSHSTPASMETKLLEEH
ncbi:hypothetical protein XA68_10015 [Ophiocordyceps unilateralis]|uniref:Uncharacterized protein n=1 Tax=Ophiocordyceps unilateralis TaxID=268505 RepID=A0A2A9PPH2_OPHUN|nr:hypothetical protein XA68_10015 [Ophiocordyceps unilateralis]